MSTDPTPKLRPATALVWREIQGELVGVDVETGAYHVFNPVGRMVWTALTEGRSLEEVRSDIVGRFGVDPERATRDIESFIIKLREKELIQ